MKELISRMNLLEIKLNNIYINKDYKNIKQELKKNREFNLFGLGKLVVVNAAARKGINPATGKKITIPASKRIKLRAGKDFKASINK